MYDLSMCACGLYDFNVYCTRQPAFRYVGVRGFGYMSPPPPTRPTSDRPLQSRAARKRNKSSRSGK